MSLYVRPVGYEKPYLQLLSDMNTPFESWKSWLLGLSPIPRSIDKLYRKSIESALEFWGMYQQKPAWYFNKKTQEFIENKDSEKTFFIILKTKLRNPY
jgi:predicted phosphoadenosine phosphosulfate sulfurtransferase